ncbi:hypothetical protein EON63_21575 [archaeon]|nr:MAG: hypothetical protein EON63_21575 [archaeon]
MYICYTFTYTCTISGIHGQHFTAFNMMAGTFGRTNARDMIAVQSLDGKIQVMKLTYTYTYTYTYNTHTIHIHTTGLRTECPRIC